MFSYIILLLWLNGTADDIMHNHVLWLNREPLYARIIADKVLIPQRRQVTRQKTPVAPPNESNNEIVVTPAGPMHKNKVYSVKPGEVVRRNQDGTFTIVPNLSK